MRGTQAPTNVLCKAKYTYFFNAVCAAEARIACFFELCLLESLGYAHALALVLVINQLLPQAIKLVC